MVDVLTPEMVELLESGVSIGVASRGRDLRPECVHGLGIRVGPDEGTVTAYINGNTSARLLACIDESRRLAITVSRIVDHHTIQLKGRVVEVRQGTAEDHAIQDRYIVAYAEQVAITGLPRSVVRRVRLRPCVALVLAVDEIYRQTPGPQAGRRIGGAA